MKEIMADDKHKIGQAVANIMRNVNDVKAWATGIRSKLTLAGADSVDVQRAMVSFGSAAHAIGGSSNRRGGNELQSRFCTIDGYRETLRGDRGARNHGHAFREIGKKNELQQKLLAAANGTKSPR